MDRKDARASRFPRTTGYAEGRVGAGDMVTGQNLLEQVELVMSNVSYDKES